MLRIILFSLLILLGLSCKDEYNFPIEPYIEFKSLKITEGVFKTIDIEIYFRDGDFDLGLTGLDIESPYNLFNYLLKDGTTVEKFDPLNLENYVSYKLKRQSLQDTLPNFSPPNDCLYWSVERDLNFKPLDTLYRTPNVNGTNILMDIYYESLGGNIKYTGNDVYPNCYYTWFGSSGRFPPPFGEAPPTFSMTKISSKEGLLTYHFGYAALNSFLPGNKIFFKIMIKDRALHESNIIETDKIQL